MSKTNTYAIGIDYGTNSCRSLLVDLESGEELGSAVFAYPTGEAGILLDAGDPNLARQNPADYLEGLEFTVKEALKQAQAKRSDFSVENVLGIGVDTTGSTPLPVDSSGVPLAFHPRYKGNLNAQAWLWKDHTGYAEAAQITELARQMRPAYLKKCGGTYSSEWFWSKILHLKNSDPELFAATHTFVEHCDYIPAVLTGQTDPQKFLRSVCAAGHKAMYSEDWGGLPDHEFLEALSPGLGGLRERLYEKAYTSDTRAGYLSPDWAHRLGLTPQTAVSVGGFDAHMGGVGAGIQGGRLVKTLGTSTCDLLTVPLEKSLQDIPGVCGVVPGSILPGQYGIEAGQSAVGDIFLWFVNNLVPESYGKSPDEKFRNLEKAAGEQKPGQHGLLALDWNNGNRTILVDPRLSGLILGQNLHTRPHEIYRALIEATAFGALTIINRIEEYGVKVESVVNCGGLAVKNSLLMQIYADVIGRPMYISSSDQTCALGAALFGAAAAGEEGQGPASLRHLQNKLCHVRDKVYQPNPEHHQIYQKIYRLYLELHDAFGTHKPLGTLGHIMKELLNLRDESR